MSAVFDVSYGRFEPLLPVSYATDEGSEATVGGELRLAPIGYLTQIPWEGEWKQLAMPVKFEVAPRGAHVSVFAPMLELHGWGRNLELAAQMLAEAIADNWRELREASPRELHPSALGLKLKLRRLLER